MGLQNFADGSRGSALERLVGCFFMGMYVSIDACVFGNPDATMELAELRRIEKAALALVRNPAWAGICDEDVELECALQDAGWDTKPLGT
jgi:hypothetical protein